MSAAVPVTDPALYLKPEKFLKNENGGWISGFDFRNFHIWNFVFLRQNFFYNEINEKNIYFFIQYRAKKICQGVWNLFAICRGNPTWKYLENY